MLVYTVDGESSQIAESTTTIYSFHRAVEVDVTKDKLWSTLELADIAVRLRSTRYLSRNQACGLSAEYAFNIAKRRVRSRRRGPGLLAYS